MSNTDFLGRAIDVVKKAIEQDTAGDYDKAYQTYYQARMLALGPHNPSMQQDLLETPANYLLSS